MNEKHRYPGERRWQEMDVCIAEKSSERKRQGSRVTTEIDNVNNQKVKKK